MAREKQADYVIFHGVKVNVVPSRPKMWHKASNDFTSGGESNGAGRTMVSPTHDEEIVRSMGQVNGQGNDRIITCLRQSGLTPKELMAKATK